MMNDFAKERLSDVDSFLSRFEKCFGLRVELGEVVEWLGDLWGKTYEQTGVGGKLAGRLGLNAFYAKHSELLVDLAVLAPRPSSGVVDGAYLRELEVRRALRGQVGIVVGGIELEALAPMGLRVVSIEPRLAKVVLPEVEGVERISERLSEALLKARPDLLAGGSLVSTSAVFEFSSGAGNDLEQEQLFGQVVSLVEPGGYLVNKMDGYGYERLVAPRLESGGWEEVFLFPRPEELYVPSSDLICVLKRLV